MLKYIKSLRDKKTRDKNKIFLIEGKKFVQEIISYKIIREVILSQSFCKENVISFFKSRFKLIILPDKLFASVSQTISPQGIMAVCDQQEHSCEKIIYKFDKIKKQNKLIVMLDQINDPGNLGSLIRSCVAFDVDMLVVSHGSVDIYNPKVLRATAGNIFKLNIMRENISHVINLLRARDFKILAADMNAKKNSHEIDFKNNLAIIMGNESNGISQEIITQSDMLIKIPMANHVESLNISCACSLILYQAYLNKIQNT